MIQRIYQHLAAEDWLRPGDVCLDVFAGTGLGGLDAALAGYQFVGVELEERFTAIAHGFDCGGDLAKHDACSQAGEHGPHHVEGNLELWQRRYGHLPQWVAPVLVQGDSRQLDQVLSEQVGACVSSPPFQTSLQNGETAGDMKARWGNSRLGGNWGQSYGPSPANLGNLPPGTLADALVASPPYANSLAPVNPDIDAKLHARKATGQTAAQATWGANKGSSGMSGDVYSANPQNLGNLPPGTLADALDGVVASPPYAGNEKSDYLLSEDGKTRRRDTKRGYKQGHGCFRGSETYGQTEGQLGAMETGAVDGLVSSPPFCDSDGRKGGSDLYREMRAQTGRSLTSPSTQAFAVPDPYGDDPAQLGNATGDTFWAAAAQILAHVFTLLKPGGVAVFVTKNYIRDGKIVPFSQDWVRLCESCGFELMHWHKALLVEEHGQQENLFGTTETIATSKKSFFRRLCESKGAPKIDWEDVLCFSVKK